MAGAVKSRDGLDLDIIIVGAGFAGMQTLHDARTRGLSARIYEGAGGVGGTWYWNRYPGARVDVQSLEYSFAFSEQLQQNWTWSERYVAQPELLRYLNYVADHFDLRKDIRLNSRVNNAAFDEQGHFWTIVTADGERATGRFLIMATGGLSAPNLPNIKGLKTFKGKWYLSGTWPHEEVSFTNQRVGVIGTGSTGIQIIPIVAQQAEHLTVFQRTANYAVPLGNAPMDVEFENEVKANYTKIRAAELDAQMGLVIAGSTITDGKLPQVSALSVSEEERNARYELLWRSANFTYYWWSYNDLLTDVKANATLAEFIKKKIRERVRDKKVADLLAPTTPVLVKRLCCETNYYETFNRPNVTLVDIKRTPIEEITERGLRVGGKEHQLDSIIFATGFDAGTGAMTRTDIRGRGGRVLKEDWEANGPRTDLGILIHGFPNLFMINGPTSPGVAFFIPVVGQNIQIKWILDCISYLFTHDLAVIEPSAADADDWRTHVDQLANATLFPTIDSWYMGTNIPGKRRQIVSYLGTIDIYKARLNAAAAKGYARLHPA
jgi:cyclohexanone monooxygenase